jgi:hypothetical protein
MKNKLLSLLSILIGSMCFGVEDNVIISGPICKQMEQQTVLESTIRLPNLGDGAPILRLICYTWDKHNTGFDDKLAEAPSVISYIYEFAAHIQVENVRPTIQACIDEVTGSMIHENGLVDDQKLNQLKELLKNQGFILISGSNKGCPGAPKVDRSIANRLYNLPPVPMPPGGNTARRLNFFEDFFQPGGNVFGALAQLGPAPDPMLGTNQATATVNSGSALPLASKEFWEPNTQSLPSYYMEALPAMSSTDTPWDWSVRTPTTTAGSNETEISSGNEYSPRSI